MKLNNNIKGFNILFNNFNFKFMKSYKPGESAPVSGQYKVIGPKGGDLGEITAIKGNTLPPSPKQNCSYVLSDATNGLK